MLFGRRQTDPAANAGGEAGGRTARSRTQGGRRASAAAQGAGEQVVELAVGLLVRIAEIWPAAAKATRAAMKMNSYPIHAAAALASLAVETTERRFDGLLTPQLAPAAERATMPKITASSPSPRSRQGRPSARAARPAGGTAKQPGVGCAAAWRMNTAAPTSRYPARITAARAAAATSRRSVRARAAVSRSAGGGSRPSRAGSPSAASQPVDRIGDHADQERHGEDRRGEAVGLTARRASWLVSAPIGQEHRRAGRRRGRIEQRGGRWRSRHSSSNRRRASTRRSAPTAR